MGGGSCAAVIDAIRRQRQAEREMRAMTRGLKERIRARRKQPQRVSAGSGRAEMACYHLCAECRHLGEAAGACAGCGATVVFDLAENAIVDRLAEEDDAERASTPWAARWAAAAAGAVVAVGAVSLGMGAEEGAPIYPVSFEGTFIWGLVGVTLLGLVTAILMGMTLPRLLTWGWYHTRPRGPARWRHAVPRVPDGAPVARVVEGRARGEGVLTAPFTGRPCLAWRVGVLFDRPWDARPPEWVLDEGEVADLEVDGHRVEGTRTTFMGQPELVRAEQRAGDAEALRRFLRVRGLAVLEGEAELFEAIVPPEGHVTLHVPATGAAFGPVLDLATEAAR